MVERKGHEVVMECWKKFCKTVRNLDDHEIKVDGYLFNLQDRTIQEPFNGYSTPKYSIDNVNGAGHFTDVIANEMKGKKLHVRKNRKDGCREVYAGDTCLMKVRDGQLTELYLPTTTRIGDNFLKGNETLEKFNAPNLQKVGEHFLENNKKSITELNAPNLPKNAAPFLHQAGFISQEEMVKQHPIPVRPRGGRGGR